MTPRQVLHEILRDYRYNLSHGMPLEQSLEVVKAMVVDLIEYEKDRSFNTGVDSGRLGVLMDLQIYGAEHVLESYRKQPAPKVKNVAPSEHAQN